jgi:adenosylcobyric acid synthase
VLGICAGLQMLGEALIDPHGIDGNGPGLGLLPLVTVFAPDKTVLRSRARFGAVTGPWSALSGCAVDGYEIHHGQTRLHPALVAAGHAARVVLACDRGWQNDAGNVLGIYLHGLFEQASVMAALFGAKARDLDAVFDGLADHVERHCAAGVLAELIVERGAVTRW